MLKRLPLLLVALLPCVVAAQSRIISYPLVMHIDAVPVVAEGRVLAQTVFFDPAEHLITKGETASGKEDSQTPERGLFAQAQHLLDLGRARDMRAAKSLVTGDSWSWQVEDSIGVDLEPEAERRIECLVWFGDFPAVLWSSAPEEEGGPRAMEWITFRLVDGQYLLTTEFQSPLQQTISISLQHTPVDQLKTVAVAELAAHLPTAPVGLDWTQAQLADLLIENRIPLLSVRVVPVRGEGSTAAVRDAVVVFSQAQALLAQGDFDGFMALHSPHEAVDIAESIAWATERDGERAREWRMRNVSLVNSGVFGVVLYAIAYQNEWGGLPRSSAERVAEEVKEMFSAELASDYAVSTPPFVLLRVEGVCASSAFIARMADGSDKLIGSSCGSGVGRIVRDYNMLQNDYVDTLRKEFSLQGNPIEENVPGRYWLD